MRVTMTSTQAGSPDGLRTHKYHKGETYDLPDRLAGVFLEEGWATKAEEPDRKERPGPQETKPAGPQETKPAEPDEPPQADAEFTKEKTSPNSPYFRFIGPEGVVVDGSGNEVKVLGERAAEEKRKELEEQYNE